MTAATQSTRGGSSTRVEPTDLQFQHGYSMAEEWVRYTAEPAEVRRLKQFTRELSLNGETPAVFVALNSVEQKHKPGEIVALYVLGPHFQDDPGAAAAWWLDRGGDIGMPNFVAGFMTGAAETN